MNFLAVGFRDGSPSLKTPGVAFWLGISLIAPLYFGLLSWFYAATSGDIVQDDARLHIVWLQRLIDPDLFPNDPIAHYYKAIQPIGLKLVYGVAASLGIEPLIFARIVPLGLALITTIYIFWVAFWILPMPISGFLATLILNQNIWLKDDLISAAPRAFTYPLFAAFLYYLLRGSRLPCLLMLGLQGLFYPQMMLVSLGMLTLRLVDWNGWKSRLSRWGTEYGVWLLALGMAGGILLTFSGFVEDQVGRLVTLAEMKSMPEFYVNGRVGYFGRSLLSFIFDGASGLRFPLFPPIILVGALLPLWFMKSSTSGSSKSSLAPRTRRSGITHHIAILPQILLSAVGLFLLAHALFPGLYLPSRYTYYSTRFVMAIAAGIVLTLITRQVWCWWLKHQRGNSWTVRRRIQGGLVVGLAIAITTIPAIPAIVLPCQGWIIGETPGIYRLLAQLPKDTLVASLTSEIDNVPAFSQRSVLVGAEFALPYHVDFYDLMTERMADLVDAQYSPDLTTVKSFIQHYGIDLWLVDLDFVNPDYLTEHRWLMNSGLKDQAMTVVQDLRQGMQPALSRMMTSCEIFREGHLVVLDAPCLGQSQGEPRANHRRFEEVAELSRLGRTNVPG